MNFQNCRSFLRPLSRTLVGTAMAALIVATATACEDPCEVLEAECKACKDDQAKQVCEAALASSVNDAACEASLDLNLCE